MTSIPNKGFQVVRYYGWYSNRARGDRAKKEARDGEEVNPAGLEVIDVADYHPPRIPSKKWRELIKSKIPARRRRGRFGKSTRWFVRIAALK